MPLNLAPLRFAIGVMEEWSYGFIGKNNFAALTTHCSRTPTLPGPDLACNN